jgi:hypothetical protein
MNTSKQTKCRAKRIKKKVKKRRGRGKMIFISTLFLESTEAHSLALGLWF